MTSRTWTDGPPLPIDVNHNTLAVSPAGVLYSLSASSFIRPHVPRDPNFLPYLHSLDLEAFLRGEPVHWQERTRGHVAGTTGGFGCTWFRSRVYCVGGASSLAHVDNGYTAAMTSYDPGTDTWQAHAPCPEAHHHAEVFVHEGRLWIVGGMGRMEDLPAPDKRPWLWPHYMRPISIFASYDADTDTWSRSYRQLPSTMYAVQAQLVVRPAAEGGGSRTTLVAVGGQHTVGEDGIALQTVVEYDFHSDVWFCHPPLPRASFGGGHGFLAARQEMHIVSGADRYRMAPIDSVMVMHLDQLTDFQACMFSDHWDGWYLGHPGHSTAQHHPYKGHLDPLGRTIGRARQHSRRELRAAREVADL